MLVSHGVLRPGDVVRVWAHTRRCTWAHTRRCTWTLHPMACLASPHLWGVGNRVWDCCVVVRVSPYQGEQWCV